MEKNESAEPLTTISDRISQAAMLGQEAFRRGAMRVPAQDARVLSLLSGLAVGQGGVQILDAWLRAWDTANLTAVEA